MDVEKAAEAAQGRCLSCGYTKEDAQFHMDHYLCRNYGKAPWDYWIKHDDKRSAHQCNT